MNLDRLPPRICGARRKHNRGFCQSPPLKNHWRCRLHGGASTGPTTPEGKEQTVAAMVAGRAKWVERMRRAKAEGWIDRFPGGRRAGCNPRPKTGNRLVDRALRQITETLEQPGPLVPQKTFDELEPHEQQAVNTGLALERLYEELALGIGQDDPKRTRSVSDTAQRVLSFSAKINPDPLRARRQGRTLELLARLKADRKPAP